MPIIKEKLEKFINSIRIPRLVDLSTNKSPKEMLDNAPKENWDRMGLDSKTSLDWPVWKLFLVCATVPASFLLAKFTHNLVIIVAFLGLIAIFIAIIKSFKSK